MISDFLSCDGERITSVVERATELTQSSFVPNPNAGGLNPVRANATKARMPAKKIASGCSSGYQQPVLITASGPASLIRSGGSAEFASMIEAATQLAFPGVEIVEVSAGNGSGASGRGGALLALCDPDSAIIAQARNELDETGLPRCAVVIFSSAPVTAPSDLADIIPAGEWVPMQVARILRATWEQHQLRRENARLRGDLMTFGSKIAHDLRTPLGGVLTTTEMLREVLAEDAPAKVPLTQPILDSTDGLVKLIERTSFFARVCASREQRQRFDMGTPFWSAFQQLERSMLHAQIAFTHPSTWPRIEGHEASLEMVWRILLGNAVQYSAVGTKMEAGWLAVTGGYRFWVRNEGVVSQEKQAKLFFPFHRLHELGAPRGLGLPMMQRLVELEGGRCGFEQLPSGRVEFFFILILPAVSTSEKSSASSLEAMSPCRTVS